MKPEEVQQRVVQLASYSSMIPVAKMTRIPIVKLYRAKQTGEADRYVIEALKEATFARLELYSERIHARGARLRLRAVFASGIPIHVMANWGRATLPQGLGRVCLSRYARLEIQSIRADHAQWIKRMFDNRHKIPTTGLYFQTLELGRERGWYRPEELELDLIDLPHQMAEEALRARVEQMTYEELRQARSEGRRQLVDHAELGLTLEDNESMEESK